MVEISFFNTKNYDSPKFFQLHAKFIFYIHVTDSRRNNVNIKQFSRMISQRLSSSLVKYHFLSLKRLLSFYFITAEQTELKSQKIWKIWHLKFGIFPLNSAYINETSKSLLSNSVLNIMDCRYHLWVSVILDQLFAPTD